eukprot:6411-Heterococcus_DN1.PRE.8
MPALRGQAEAHGCAVCVKSNNSPPANEVQLGRLLSMVSQLFDAKPLGLTAVFPLFTRQGVLTPF